MVVTAAMSISVMGLSVLLLDRYGLTGLGVAWLASQSVIAIVLLVTELRAVWLPPRPLAPPAPLLVRPDPRGRCREPALAAAEGWDPAGSPGPTAISARSWSAPRPTAGLGVLRFARTPTGATGLHRHQAALEAIAKANVPADWYRVAPEILASNEAARRPWLVETHLTGVDGREVTGIHGPDVIAARGRGDPRAARRDRARHARRRDGADRVGRRPDRGAALDGRHAAARGCGQGRARPAAGPAARRARRPRAHDLLRARRLLARQRPRVHRRDRSPGSSTGNGPAPPASPPST